MTEPFNLLVLDTYGVTFVRSPRYLDVPLAEEVDEASRELVDEARFWARVRRVHRLSDAEVEELQAQLAAKYCKNLNVWSELPGWGRRFRLLLLHGGPAGLLARWQREYRVDAMIPAAVSSAALGLSRAEPSLYARLAADAGLAPERCLLVDDERAPVEAAREAGFAVYRFGTVYGLRAVLAEAAGDKPRV